MIKVSGLKKQLWWHLEVLKGNRPAHKTRRKGSGYRAVGFGKIDISALSKFTWKSLQREKFS